MALGLESAFVCEVDVCVCMHACVYVCTCVCMCVHACTCVCLPLRVIITIHVKCTCNNWLDQFYTFYMTLAIN